VSRRKANLAGLLEGLATLSWRAAERALCLEPHDDFAASSLLRAGNRELLEAAATHALGAGAVVRHLTARPVAKKAPSPEAAARETSRSAAREHPLVQSVLSVFGGDVAEVSPPAPETNAPDESEDPKR
jgi:hypothetical protein